MKEIKDVKLLTEGEITKHTRMDLDDIDKLIELSQEEVKKAKNKILDFIYSELISTHI